MRIVQPPGDAEMSLLLDLTNGSFVNTDILLFRDKFYRAWGLPPNSSEDGGCLERY